MHPKHGQAGPTAPAVQRAGVLPILCPELGRRPSPSVAGVGEGPGPDDTGLRAGTVKMIYLCGFIFWGGLGGPVGSLTACGILVPQPGLNLGPGSESAES